MRAVATTSAIVTAAVAEDEDYYARLLRQKAAHGYTAKGLRASWQWQTADHIERMRAMVCTGREAMLALADRCEGEEAAAWREKARSIEALLD
jgi:hypothetical protein